MDKLNNVLFPVWIFDHDIVRRAKIYRCDKTQYLLDAEVDNIKCLINNRFIAAGNEKMGWIELMWCNDDAIKFVSNPPYTLYAVGDIDYVINKLEEDNLIYRVKVDKSDNTNNNNNINWFDRVLQTFKRRAEEPSSLLLNEEKSNKGEDEHEMFTGEAS